MQRAAIERLVQGQSTSVHTGEIGVLWVKGIDQENEAVRARVSIFDPSTRDERQVTLEVGDTLQVGDRSYRVSALRLRSADGERSVVELEPAR